MGRWSYLVKLAFLVFILLFFASAGWGQFQVNSHTGQDQSDCAVAVDANNNFVVVWRSYGQDGDSGGIFGQLFDANGEPVGGEFQVNTTTAGNQKAPDVAMDADGDFVVVWHGAEIGLEDVFARWFDANAQAPGDEFRVNTYTDSRQLFPSVAMNNDGNFVIVWESKKIPEQPDKKLICGRLYDSSGSSLGDEFDVTTTDEVSAWRYADVAMHSTGRFIVVWLRDSSYKSIRFRHFDANGTASYAKPLVNDLFNFTSLTEPQIAIDDEGNYVIAWDGHPDSYLLDDIYLRRYHLSFAPLHSQECINTYQAGAQSNPSVAVNGDGDFIVLWQSETDKEGAEADIFGQRFGAQPENTSEAILLGQQFRINTYIAHEQSRPAVAIRGDSFITAWQSDGQDGSGAGIFGQLGPKAGCADFSDDGFVNFMDFCILAEQWLKDGQTLQTDLIEDDKVDERDLAAFCRQWLGWCFRCSEVDFDGDGDIDFADYAIWSSGWSQIGPGLPADIDKTGIVDLADFELLTFHWLRSCQE